MRRFIAVAVVLFSLSAFADTIEIQPPNPDSTTQITALLGGIDGCTPRDPQVTVNGSDITIALKFGDVCPAIAAPYAVSVRLPILPAGNYTLRVVPSDRANLPEASRTTFSVSEANPRLLLSSHVASIAGGDVVIITAGANTTFGSSPSVTFGGVPATNVESISGAQVRAHVPPHAAGAVTVNVNGVEAINVFRYYDPNATPDPAVFETVLIPMLFEGPGAFDSKWTTELFVRNDNYVPVTSYRPLYYTGCPGIGSTICDAPIPTFKTVQIFPVSNLSSNGLLFHPLREQAGALSFAARVRDTSRESEDFGAELPIVRESDFRRGGKIVFPDVIIDPRYRTTLRFYSIDDAFLDIEVLQGGVTVGFRFLNPTKGAGDVAWTATVDLSSIVRRSTSNRYTVVANVGSLVARIWAFMSVTNNTTQRVTIISPQ